MRALSTVIITLLFVVLLAVIGAYVVVRSGWYNVAATDEHLGTIESLLHSTKEASIRAHAADLDISLPSDSMALRRGYVAYEDMCVVCHGAPGKDRGWMGQGMTPEPPDLALSAEEFSPEEIYWVLRHGIKLAGMPALEPTHDDAEILELAAFVEALPEMTEAEYAALGRTNVDTPPGDGHEGHEH